MLFPRHPWSYRRISFSTDNFDLMRHRSPVAN
jgi:hypothetical protein